MGNILYVCEVTGYMSHACMHVNQLVTRHIYMYVCEATGYMSHACMHVSPQCHSGSHTVQ